MPDRSFSDAVQRSQQDPVPSTEVSTTDTSPARALVCLLYKSTQVPPRSGGHDFGPYSNEHTTGVVFTGFDPTTNYANYGPPPTPFTHNTANGGDLPPPITVRNHPTVLPSLIYKYIVAQYACGGNQTHGIYENIPSSLGPPRLECRAFLGTVRVTLHIHNILQSI
jgi:hypothetical protein